MNKYFKLNFVNAWMCSPSLSEPHLNFRPTCGRRTECQMETQMISRESFRSQTARVLVISHWYFAENNQEL